ncbi:DeoR/GlpR transcriptional regulator [Aquamicrobium sp. LC103]|nr:DeoR/GlpR transcriptional regulator [Aquamicrobium sp. LC103]
MMRSFERFDVILGLLQAQDYVTIEDMAAACDTSPQTIRRDLNVLARDGKVQRYHGGARLPEAPSAATYEVRSTSHVEEKKVAAGLLPDLIPDHSSLFIAGGSTLALAAQCLRVREGLTIVTNNLHAAISLYDKIGFEIHVVGGAMRPASGSLTGDEAARIIERFSLDFALIGTCGIAADGALLEYDQSLVPPLLAMIANARETILVADSSKFASTGIVRSTHLRSVDRLLTNETPPAASIELVNSFGVSLHLPGS